ncbi:MAG: helix-turn-helix transcriptional regulator [Actinomycetota bacterium]
MDAGTAIANARAAAGLTLRELAQLAGTSHSTIAAYENGRKSPNVNTFARVMRAAGFAVDSQLQRRIGSGDDAREARGRELIEVLELAAMFPARVERRLSAAPFAPSS